MDRSLRSGWTRIATGNAAAGGLRLAALAIAARSTTVSEFGVLALIEAYVRMVDGFLNFQSVNVLTKFLAEADLGREANRFRGFVKIGLLVDSATALVSCILAVLLLRAVGPSFGIPAEWAALASLYCTVVLTRILGTPEAVLRCLDRYWEIGWREALVGLLTAVLSLAAWKLEAPAGVFLLIWLGAESVVNLLFVIWMFVVIREKGLSGIWRASVRDTLRSARGFWAMLWQTNLTFGLRMFSQTGDLLVAGAVLGAPAAGSLRVAKSIVAFVNQFGRPLQQVTSAPISRLWTEGRRREMVRYTRDVCLIAGVAGLLATGFTMVFGDVALRLVFGSAYADSTSILTILMLASTVYLCGITLLPTMLAMRMSTGFLFGVVLGTLAFAVILGVTVVPLGNLGIALAHVAFNATWAIYCWRRVLRAVAVREA